MFLTNIRQEQQAVDIPLADGTSIRECLGPGETRIVEEINPYDIQLEQETRDLITNGYVRISFAEDDDDLQHLPRILPAVTAASTGNIATLAGFPTIDGVTLNYGDRVLVKDQTDPTQNGVYQVQSGGWFRSHELEFSEQFVAHVAMFVKNGIANKGSVYTLVSPEFPTITVDPILWDQWPGAGGSGVIEDAINVGLTGVSVVATPSTAGTDLRFRSIAAGDGIGVTVDAPNEAVNISLTAEYGHTLLFGADIIGSSTTVRYLYAGSAERIAEVVPNQARLTRDAELRNLFVQHNTPAGNGGDVTYTVRVNGVATLVATTLASTSAFGSNLIDSINVIAGDVVDIQITKAASIGASPRNVVATLEVK